MNAILSGVKLPGVLSFRTYIAKVIGITAMLTSGMSIGKLGPFVHIAGCLASSLPYKDLKKNKTLKHQFLVAAVVVGVGCTFGAPIGGLLFAIEVSSTTFTVQNLWKGFFACTISVLCFKMFQRLQNIVLFNANASYFYQGDLPIGINRE